MDKGDDNTTPSGNSSNDRNAAYQQQNEEARISVDADFDSNFDFEDLVDFEVDDVLDADDDDNDDTDAIAAERRIEQHVKNRTLLHSILNEEEDFPLRQRTKISDLVQEFVTKLGNDINAMMLDQDYNDYHGLDSDRDTQQELETALRLYPEIIAGRHNTLNNSRYDILPIQCITHMYGNDGKYVVNVKALPFLPLLVRLAIEFGSYDTDSHHHHHPPTAPPSTTTTLATRGGLLIPNQYEGNVLQRLVKNSHPSYGNVNQHNQVVDATCLDQLVLLQRSGWITQDNILEHTLVLKLCGETGGRGGGEEEAGYFSPQRFRFLVDWNPQALLQTTTLGCLPLHYAAYSLQGFRTVLDAGLRYFSQTTTTTQRGGRGVGIRLLFQKTDGGSTPIKTALHHFQYNKQDLMTVIEEILQRYTTTDTVTGNDNNNNNNFRRNNDAILDDTILTAAMDESIHLDCVYFLLRRQPDALRRLLFCTIQRPISSSSSPSSPPSSSSLALAKSNSRNIKQHRTHNKNSHIKDGIDKNDDTHKRKKHKRG